MNQGRSRKSTVFTMSAWENMEIQTCGKALPNFSITYHLPQWYKIKYSAYMEVFRQV